MYQVALGGYYLSSTNTSILHDSPIYYEPGFNIMYPLELEIPKCDIFYILIRKRRDRSGSLFENLSPSILNFSVQDSSIGENVISSLTTSLTNSKWGNDSSFTPIVLVVENNFNINNDISRVVSLDIFISDKNDNTFIKLRTNISDTERFCYFMPIYTDKLSDRSKNSAVGKYFYFTSDASSDGYLLLSPYSSFNEVLEWNGDISFSYPPGSIFYKRQKSYNNENFDFSISSCSHSFVEDNISLMNVPGYRKVAVLHVDANMHKELSNISTNAFVNIESIGVISNVSDIFRINFTR